MGTIAEQHAAHQRDRDKRAARRENRMEDLAAKRAARGSGFAGVEPGGGFSEPPGGVGVSAPGLQMDGGTPQAFPRPDVGMPPPAQGRPALPRPMPGQAAPAPGGLPQNLPVPPGGGGGWGPGKAGTPGQTGAPVKASPFAGVRPMPPGRPGIGGRSASY